MTALGVEVLDLLDEVRRGAIGAPLRKAALAAVQLGRLWDRLGGVSGLDVAGLTAVLEVVIAERSSAAAPHIELVWTGPEGKNAWSRPTAQVVRELFWQARSHVLLAGYSFDHGREILEPLHAARATTARSASRTGPIAPSLFRRDRTGPCHIPQPDWGVSAQ